MNEAKLTHLTHVEDLVWISGYQGAKDTIKYLEKTLYELKGHNKKDLKTFQKVDGAPAVIAGWNPENGKFFVATKSLFNKTPKINYTNEDIDINHGKARELSSKLKDALKYLPDVIKKGNIVQGDFMYSKSDLSTEVIENVKGVSFKPNTIKYFVDASSGLYRTIMASKIGIIFHTTYLGATIHDLSAVFTINESIFNKSKDVYFRTTYVKSYDPIDFTSAEYDAYNKSLSGLKTALSKFKKDELSFLTNKDISVEIQTYINHKVRNGKSFSKHEITELINFIMNKYQRAIDKLKTDKAKDKKTEEQREFIQRIRQSAGTLYYLFKWAEDARDLKILILDKLNQIQAPETPYIEKNGKYVVTDPEGYVISNSDESGVKFVNRSVFSAMNFLNNKFK